MDAAGTRPVKKSRGFRWKESKPDEADSPGRGRVEANSSRDNAPGPPGRSTSHSPPPERAAAERTRRPQDRDGQRREQRDDQRPRLDDYRDGSREHPRSDDGRRAGRRFDAPDGARRAASWRDDGYQRDRGGNDAPSRARSRSPDRQSKLLPERTQQDRIHAEPKKGRAPAAAAAAAAPITVAEMIIVHVNDRLGTKSAVPCLPSDLIRDFKMLVAARIGREPHEIVLKRQGERPFKDQLTLEDYGVSNGVQLDLEVDTGD